MAHCTVQFVNATVSNPSAPKDPAVRALIRKQAMKQAAETRRRDGSYGKHNLRQYPVFYLNANVEPAPVEEEYLEEANRHTAELMVPQQIWWSRSATSWNTNRKHLLDGLLLPASIAPSPSVQGYELITQKNGFDIVDLSTLATYHVGRATAEALSSDPLQLINLLRFKQWSYLSYLPGLYGRSACLKDAVDCIIARVRQILAPTGDIGHKEVIWHYLRAIDSLQKALNCPRQRLDADVLCATEILALYELLDPSGKEPWIRHANGAARLIQLRGPENYNTEFEKALFMAHSGPIITESLLNNERCFLAHPSWHSVFNSLILISPNTGPLSDRSPTVIALLILKSRVSALFADITSAICNLSPSNPRLASDDRPSPLEDLRTQAQQLRDDLLAWKRDCDILLETFVVSAAEGSMDFNKRAESTATYLSCRMITNRLLASVSRSESARLERETQFLAAQMLWLEDSVKDVCPHTRLFLVQTVAVARSILATAGEWMGLEGGGREGVMEMETGAVERWRFERWCALFGRKVS